MMVFIILGRDMHRPVKKGLFFLNITMLKVYKKYFRYGKNVVA